MKNFDTNANELIAHTHSLLSKKKVKIQDLI